MALDSQSFHTGGSGMIEVLIADDHAMVRQGFRAFLEQGCDIKVVGEAADGLETLGLVKELNPDIALMDIVMPKVNGILATRQIQYLGVKTKVIMVSMCSESVLVQQAIHNGARGYILKSSEKEELIQAIKIVHRGKVYFCPEIMEILIARISDPTQITGTDIFTLLTAREIEVLQLISEGETNTSIAVKMNIGVKTIEKHRSTIMAKLNIHHTAGLVKYAIKNGLAL